MDEEQLKVEVWKQVLEGSRHWESIYFETAKLYITLVTASLGAAGAVAAWSGSDLASARWAVVIILLVTGALAARFGQRALESQQAYLDRHYKLRREFENNRTFLTKADGKGSKETVPTMKALFVNAQRLCGALALLAAVAAILPAVAAILPARIPASRIAPTTTSPDRTPPLGQASKRMAAPSAASSPGVTAASGAHTPKRATAPTRVPSRRAPSQARVPRSRPWESSK